MALTTATSRVTAIPPGYRRRTRYYQEVSESSEPSHEFHPAHYLPVVAVNRRINMPYVMYAGTIVAFSTMTNQGTYLTFANGGTAATITYTALDVYDSTDEYTYMVEDIDSLGSRVTAAGAGVTTDAINYPIGFSAHNYYSDVYRFQYNNFNIQDVVTVTCDKFIEIPVLTSDQQTGVRALTSGRLVSPVPGTAGVAGMYRPGVDAVDQIIGRCIHRGTIAARSGLDKVSTTKGLNLPGVDTAGFPSHLNHTGVTEYARIIITLA